MLRDQYNNGQSFQQQHSNASTTLLQPPYKGRDTRIFSVTTLADSPKEPQQSQTSSAAAASSMMEDQKELYPAFQQSNNPNLNSYQQWDWDFRPVSATTTSTINDLNLQWMTVQFPYPQPLTTLMNEMPNFPLYTSCAFWFKRKVHTPSGLDRHCRLYIS